MAWTLAWLKDPRGFLKFLILVTILLSLTFFAEGVGFLQIPEFRLYFIVCGGYVLILSYRILSYIFAGRLKSGPEEVVADIVGSILLMALATLLVIRGTTEMGHMSSSTDQTSDSMPLLTLAPLEKTVSPKVFEENWIFIFVSAGCGFMAGLILAIDACCVLRQPVT